MSGSQRTKRANLNNKQSNYNRRQFFKTGAAAVAASSYLSSRPAEAAVSSPEAGDNSKLLWGDIHYHTNLSDGNGTPEECMEVAKSHLDFWAMTDHAYDEVVFSLDYSKFPGRTTLVNKEWPRIQQLCRDNEAPGRFIPILAYEWTNFQYGHHNVYYLEYDQPIRMPPTLPELYEAVESVEAFVIPHHTGYPIGICGKNWDFHNERISPFVEIYSAHGSSEDSEGLRQTLVLGSWMGPGESEGSVQAGLARGHKLGIIASTDSHINHPGAYDLGLVGVYAGELTRKALWESFRKRRIYGVTGDRIQLDFSINGQPMGSTLRASGPRSLRIAAVAWDQIERVEVLKNNAIVHTFTRPEGALSSQDRKRIRFHVEWGWDARKEHDWGASLTLEKGKILQSNPCFRGNMAGRAGTGIMKQSDSHCQWTSKTEKARYDGQARRFGDGMAFEIECADKDPIELTVNCDDLRQQLRVSPVEMLRKSGVRYMENIPPTNDGNYWRSMEVCSKFKIHQARPTEQLTVDLAFEDDARSGKPGGTDFYYVRLIQRNGQMAWSSPIWVETAG